MGAKDYAKKGDYNVICDQCGFKFKVSECMMQWDNLYVCFSCHEPRQPQDFVRGVTDKQAVPIARPDVNPEFITIPVTPEDL